MTSRHQPLRARNTYAPRDDQRRQVAVISTYATRYKAGIWKLYDDARHAAPTYKEVCGRSSMSSWMNSVSMAGFSSGFAAPSKQRLLDEDEYWVAFPEFAHCGTADKLTCTVPKP